MASIIIRAGSGDPNPGAVILDLNSNVSRFLGSVSTTTAAGSLTDARIDPTRFAHFTRSASFDGHGKTVSVVGTTMSWTASNFASEIEYWVF